MASLSLNTSITSSHRDDFYSEFDGTHWYIIKNVYGNYFTDPNSPVPCDNIIFYQRIESTQEWKLIGTCNSSCGYHDYTSCNYDLIYAFYYNFNNPSDPDNNKPIDKIRVTYGGMTAESFVDRCFVNITAKDNYGNPLPNVVVLDDNIPTTNDTNFLIFTSEEDFEKPNPLYTDITSEMRNCNTNVSLMQTEKEYDTIVIETYGIPNKLTFTISTPGVYSGTLHFQYWNGTQWTYFPEEQLTDNTNGFRKSGTNDVILPSVSDWKKRTVGKKSELFYVCRAIFDSSLTITTVPRASCFRWSGYYKTVTNTNGQFSFTKFTGNPHIYTNDGRYVTINILGKLDKYICTSGNGEIWIAQGTSNKDITLTLTKSDISNNLTCPTTVYKYQTKDIVVTANTNIGNLLNTLTISSPKTTTTTFRSSATKFTRPYTFNEETTYKIQLISKDIADNTTTKICYVIVTSPPSCDILTDQTSCELNKCYWTGSSCISTDPHIELSEIYQSIIDKTICLPNICVPTLDLNNDNVIDINDKNLASNLTYDECVSKLLSYHLCKEMNECDSHQDNSLILSLIVGAAAAYYLYKKSKNT